MAYFLPPVDQTHLNNEDNQKKVIDTIGRILTSGRVYDVTEHVDERGEVVLVETFRSTDDEDIETAREFLWLSLHDGKNHELEEVLTISQTRRALRSIQELIAWES